MNRSSGILMAISSLPSSHGIGTMGKAAYAFADFLKSAGQSYWQMLPLGPTGFGDSPYQSVSGFAGNPYLIDLDLLAEDGLLTEEELRLPGENPDICRVDYGRLYETRYRLLSAAKQRGWQRDRREVAAFEERNSDWLPDYALFMACKDHFGGRPWREWPDGELRAHKREAVDRYGSLLKDRRDLYVYLQFLFFRQWESLREYIHGLGIRIIGDLPIYAAMDSADVWAHQELFFLSGDGTPVDVSGVPPDYFCEDGQLWGNPLYRWDAMKEDGYGWWIRRVGAAAKLFDVIRMDHFRGFDEYWAVPYGEATARRGEWRKGPGLPFLRAISGWYSGVEFIAEDLGLQMDSVRTLMGEIGWPGMCVMQFAFDGDETNRYLPHNHTENCVCYSGTHDNQTIPGWLETAPEETLRKAERYLGLSAEEGYASGMLRGGMASVSRLFVSQIQDWTGEGENCRMNTPGTLGGGNWCYRVKQEGLTPALARRIREMTKRYGRLGEDLPRT